MNASNKWKLYWTELTERAKNLKNCKCEPDDRV